MTVGELARRTGTTVKALREYEAMGLVYSIGRSQGNYRLFDDSALWCVRVIHTLRGLGLTLAEIAALADVYLGRPDETIGPHLAERLRAVRGRIDAQIAQLQQVRQRIDEFATAHPDELRGRSGADFRDTDPTFR